MAKIWPRSPRARIAVQLAAPVVAGAAVFTALRLASPPPTPASTGGRPAAWVLIQGLRSRNLRTDRRIAPVGTTRGPLRPVAAASSWLFGQPQAVITPDGQTIYVLTYPWVTPYSTATGRRGPRILGGHTPDDIAITPNGKTVYVLAERGNTATPINARTGRGGRPIPVGIEPRNIVFTPDSRTAYVVNQGSGTVTPINIATNTAGRPIKIGFGPWILAITPDGKTVYVADGGPTITPINTATNKPGKPINVGLQPF